MTSVLTTTRQISADSGYFIALSSIATKVYTPASVLAVAAGTSTTLVAWTPPDALDGAGDLLKDMGRTIVGQGLTFRKVQYVDPNGDGGVGGPAPGDGTDYYTGYILLGFNGAAGTTVTGASIAPVAKYGV